MKTKNFVIKKDICPNKSSKGKEQQDTDKLLRSFGSEIRYRRKLLGLSQEAVAIRLNMARSTLSAYENDITLPTIPDLINIGIFYGITDVDLLRLISIKKAPNPLHLIETKEFDYFASNQHISHNLPATNELDKNLLGMFNILNPSQKRHFLRILYDFILTFY